MSVVDTPAVPVPSAHVLPAHVLPAHSTTPRALLTAAHAPLPTAPVRPETACSEAAQRPETAHPETARRRFLTVTSAILLLAAFSALVGTGLDMWSAHKVRSWIPLGAGYANSFGPGWDGSLNRLSYFTAQSNILVAVSSLLLVVRTHPRGRLLPFLQLVALLDISITCIVYVGVLAGPNIGGNFPTEVIVATILQHIVTPLLAWAAWLLSGPAHATPGSVALASLVPLTYCLLTLVRGALVDWYPYPFLDVPALGYARVLSAVGCVALLLPVLGLVMMGCQRLLRPRPAPRTAAPAPAALPAGSGH